MFCENCGEEIQDGAVFCVKCGAKQHSSQLMDQQNPIGQYERPIEPIRIEIPPVQKPRRSESPRPAIRSSNDVDQISMGQYLIMFLIMSIPIVGIVMMFVWAFGSQSGPNKKNFARAYLVMLLIAIVLGVVMSFVMGAIAASMMSTLYY